MPSQTDFWAESKGAALKRAGMAQAEANEALEWRQGYQQIADEFVSDLYPGMFFTGESVRKAVEARQDEPHHPNVWGSVFNACLRRWVKAGLVQPTNRVILADNTRAHRRAIRVYMKQGL